MNQQPNVTTTLYYSIPLDNNPICQQPNLALWSFFYFPQIFHMGKEFISSGEVVCFSNFCHCTKREVEWSSITRWSRGIVSDCNAKGTGSIPTEHIFLFWLKIFRFTASRLKFWIVPLYPKYWRYIRILDFKAELLTLYPHLQTFALFPVFIVISDLSMLYLNFQVRLGSYDIVLTGKYFFER